jgi:hypothetical protein
MECRTNRLGFAAYLLASKSLTLLRIERSGSTAILVFDDPADQGPDLELSFTSGDATISAVAYHSHLRGLRRKIESVVATRQEAN